MSDIKAGRLSNVIELLKIYRKKKFVKYGIPFLILMVGGSFGLRNFTNLRYEYSKKLVIDPEEIKKKYGIEMKKPGEVTLESEYEKIKDVDLDSWENIRGPRPWEGNYQTPPAKKS